MTNVEGRKNDSMTKSQRNLDATDDLLANSDLDILSSLVIGHSSF